MNCKKCGIPKLGFFKLHPEVQIPEFSTEGSACFDIRVFYSPGDSIIQYTDSGIEFDPFLYKRETTRTFELSPNGRYLIPTGLILDIPEGYSVRLHPRSGLALKSGLTLVNCEGVIDSDYVEPLFVAIHNTSENFITLDNGMRICQGELVKDQPADIVEIVERPTKKTTRQGGFGSTGVD